MKNTLLSPDLLRQVFILALILLSGFLIIGEMLPYLSGVLGAITLFTLFKGLMRKMLDRGLGAVTAASVIILTSIIIVIIPLWLIIRLIFSRIEEATKHSNTFIEALRERLKALESVIDLDFASEIQPQAINSWVSDNLELLLGSTFQVLVTLSIMYFLLFYMLIYVKEFKNWLRQFLPLNHKTVEMLADEIDQIVRSNALGIPMVALMQGIIALLGYYLFGAPNPLFWFVITIFGSMIPIIGTALAIIPVTLILFTSGHTWAALGMLLYGIFVVGTTDNLFRIFIQNKIANLHPLITLIGVVIGIPLFGFLGLIFGPLLLSLFMLLIKIYTAEYGEMQEEGEEDE
ncbi:AI-2E family transporter [Robertkochia marina]|uniref:AI-2E family transporter n=1 Tax=Robertkochia marina TaxID=1227945 RepID=A0A4S3M485_9FLAO|nr:AI-2E family transporter [Robertkochia marina]THD69976.1 AI-2E family transporter [Robertkochia marina]TRZ46679.1 AI-2E family transporter [Robertkochia marina]